MAPAPRNRAKRFTTYPPQPIQKVHLLAIYKKSSRASVASTCDVTPWDECRGQTWDKCRGVNVLLAPPASKRPSRTRDVACRELCKSATWGSHGVLCKVEAACVPQRLALLNQGLHPLGGVSAKLGNDVCVGIRGQRDLRVAEYLHYDSRWDLLH